MGLLLLTSLLVGWSLNVACTWYKADLLLSHCGCESICWLVRHLLLYKALKVNAIAGVSPGNSRARRVTSSWSAANYLRAPLHLSSPISRLLWERVPVDVVAQAPQVWEDLSDHGQGSGHVAAGLHKVLWRHKRRWNCSESRWLIKQALLII